MSQTAKKSLPAHTGIGGGQDAFDARPCRITMDVEVMREGIIQQLGTRMAKYLTPEVMQALKDPKSLERFDQEVESAFLRIAVLHSR